MPNGTYGGVRGGAGDSPTYSIYPPAKRSKEKRRMPHNNTEAGIPDGARFQIAPHREDDAPSGTPSGAEVCR